MYKIVLLLLLVLFFSGCISEPKPSGKVKNNEKIFEAEDTYILFALRAEQIKDYPSASKLFNTLYEKSNKKEYLYRSLGNDLAMGKNKKVITRVDEFGDRLDDFRLVRFKTLAYIGEADYESARVQAIDLVEKSKKVNDYLLVSEIYVKQKKYDTALKYLESAYTKDYNEQILDKMAIILYVNLQRQKDAIAQLETHSRVNGCSKQICSRLIGFYSNENNIDGLLSTYLRLYELDKSSDISKRIVEIYMYQKNYIKLMSFLQKNGSDDDMLLQMYINFKNYKKAFKLSQKLYSDNNEMKYLGQSAMFEYESSKDKDDVEMQKRVVTKLKRVVKEEQTPLYLNYLGYLLIDHSIDVKAGMEYVKQALKINKNSAFYLDSLSWGYYRLGECEKALEIIKNVRELDGGDDPEVLKHLRAIQKCTKKQ